MEEYIREETREKGKGNETKDFAEKAQINQLDRADFSRFMFERLRCSDLYMVRSYGENFSKTIYFSIAHNVLLTREEDMRSGRGSTDYTQKLKKKVMGLGADLVGVANVLPLKQLKLDPPGLLDPFHRAVSIAVALPRAVFEQIEDGPTPLYASVYQTANRFLDEIAFQTARILQGDGFNSLPIPASQVLDRRNWYGAISHKAVGRMAGLGWQGKSLLLINPEHGPRIRLTTVLTEAALNVDGPVDNRCGDCMLCSTACPVGAIKGISIQDHYKDREEALHLSKCADTLTKKFSGLPNVGAPICGICIKACPFGH